MPYSGNDQSDTGKPLVEMRTNVWLTVLPRQILAKLPHTYTTSQIIVVMLCYVSLKTKTPSMYREIAPDNIRVALNEDQTKNYIGLI